jgi:hypothetical protein
VFALTDALPACLPFAVPCQSTSRPSECSRSAKRGAAPNRAVANNCATVAPSPWLRKCHHQSRVKSTFFSGRGSLSKWLTVHMLSRFLGPCPGLKGATAAFSFFLNCHNMAHMPQVSVLSFSVVAIAAGTGL